MCVSVESFVPMKGFNVAENGKIIRFLVVVTIEQMLMYLVVTVSRGAGVQGSMAHKQENKTKGRPLTKEKDECCCCYRSSRFCHVCVCVCVCVCVLYTATGR